MADYTLSDYHERSKHRLNRYAPGPGRLDWANQPNPFRRYEGAVRIELPLLADNLETRYGPHDCGQASAAVSYAASARGWRSRLFAAPSDAQIAALLGLDRDAASAEAEAPDCLLWISAGEPPPAELPPAPSRWLGKANR